jgi:hypothetical protein
MNCRICLLLQIVIGVVLLPSAAGAGPTCSPSLLSSLMPAAWRVTVAAAAVLGGCAQVSVAWNDIAGALTYKGTHHVFQGCPRNGGWHHAASTDQVHWQDRGIHVKAEKESYEGFTSDTSPCSGFVTVDDGGTPCAGFRQCGSLTGLTGLNPKGERAFCQLLAPQQRRH